MPFVGNILMVSKSLFLWHINEVVNIIIVDVYNLKIMNWNTYNYEWNNIIIWKLFPLFSGLSLFYIISVLESDTQSEKFDCQCLV